MTHEQKPESAEFRTREAQADWMARCITWSGDHPGLPGFLREHLAQAEARGVAEQRRKDAETSKARLFSNREQAAADRTPQREDVRQWQTDQKEFFLSSMIEVVTEYAEWRDRKDAEGVQPVKWQRKNPGHGWIDTPVEDLPFYRGRGFPIRPLYTLPAKVAALIAEAVAAERERCVEIVRKHGISPFPIDDPNPNAEEVNATLQNITAAIREGGE